ncbi:hypothetical protein NPIL_95221 [Nephila pilipes]|uniref:Uncharacterized protein n=1 Tax=Nephila pilipes TaxID=299642 RepID=A0A8X6TUB4_NEPPI|nr:hypothetical protein NPIL_95221 [Nephila pilipes]
MLCSLTSLDVCFVARERCDPSEPKCFVARQMNPEADRSPHQGHLATITHWVHSKNTDAVITMKTSFIARDRCFTQHKINTCNTPRDEGTSRIEESRLDSCRENKRAEEPLRGFDLFKTSLKRYMALYITIMQHTVDL